MDVGAMIEADTKTAEVVKPRMRTFNNPAEFTQATTMFGAAPGNHRLDATLAKPLAMGVGIVSTVCIDDLRLLKRPTACAANGWNGVNERQQLGDVIAVRTQSGLR